MCTRVLSNFISDQILVGRNMDWPGPMAGNIWIGARGAKRVGFPGDANSFDWVSRYGNVSRFAWNLGASDGINEVGLGAHLLWLSESDFGPRDPARPALGTFQWAQYFLDQCASVAECVAATEATTFQVQPQTLQLHGKEMPLTIHLALEDKSGDSAVIEYIGGQPKVYHGRANQVMTNSPPYDMQADHLKQYQGFGGTLPLPGTQSTADRFVRASYYLPRLEKSPSLDWSYAGLLSIMRNAAQPFEIGGDNPFDAATQWRTVLNLSDSVYAYESSYRPNLVWIDLKKLDFSKSQVLDLDAADLIGEVSGKFQPHAPL